MKENKSTVRGSACIAFALLFILVGAVQFILGYNKGLSVQIIIAVATWVYALILLAVGFDAEERRKKAEEQADAFGAFDDTGMTDDADVPSAGQFTIALAEERIVRYANLTEADDETRAEFAQTAEGVKLLCSDARQNMKSAEKAYNDAVDRAADAYLNLDDKSALYKRTAANVNPNSRSDAELLERAKRSLSRAKQNARQADAIVEEAKMALERARQEVSRTSKARRACEKLSPRF